MAEEVAQDAAAGAATAAASEPVSQALGGSQEPAAGAAATGVAAAAGGAAEGFQAPAGASLADRLSMAVDQWFTVAIANTAAAGEHWSTLVSARENLRELLIAVARQ